MPWRLRARAASLAGGGGVRLCSWLSCCLGRLRCCCWLSCVPISLGSVCMFLIRLACEAFAQQVWLCLAREQLGITCAAGCSSNEALHLQRDHIWHVQERLLRQR